MLLSDHTQVICYALLLQVQNFDLHMGVAVGPLAVATNISPATHGWWAIQYVEGFFVYTDQKKEEKGLNLVHPRASSNTRS